MVLYFFLKYYDIVLVFLEFEVDMYFLLYLFFFSNELKMFNLII